MFRSIAKLTLSTAALSALIGMLWWWSARYHTLRGYGETVSMAGAFIALVSLISLLASPHPRDARRVARQASDPNRMGNEEAIKNRHSLGLLSIGVALFIVGAILERVGYHHADRL